MSSAVSSPAKYSTILNAKSVVTPGPVSYTHLAVDTGVPAINRKINSFLLLSDALNPLQIIISIISIIWLAGIIAMLIFALISFLRLRRKIAMTAPYKDNILLCDAVKSPFILGIFRPKIYLPSTTVSYTHLLSLSVFANALITLTPDKFSFITRPRLSRRFCIRI